MVRRGVGKWTNRSSPSNHDAHVILLLSSGPTEQSRSRVVSVNQTSRGVEES